MKNKMLFILMAVFILMSFVACSGTEKTSSDKKDTTEKKKVVTEKLKIVKSSKGNFQFSITDKWKETKKLHDEAEIQLINSDQNKEMYIITLAESKDDFAENAKSQDHYNLILENMKETLKEYKSEKPESLDINGNEATQGVVSGVSDKIKVKYLLTSVATKDKFVQILGWSLSSEFDDCEKELQKVVDSFKPISEEE